MTDKIKLRPSLALELHRDSIREIALRHRVKNARVFGSVLHGDTEDSDLDLLVDPTSETRLMDIGAIRYELKELLGISVDVLTPKSLPEKFRYSVLAEAKPV
ncbi:MAG: nucleotidyltransferase domain-containing protein [Methylococcales bacterium]